MHDLNQGVSRMLIQTIVQKAIKDIKESPERSTRNLIDMALNFSVGRFQTHFLEAAQKMLRNEHSSYYSLVQDIALHVDTEKLLNFCMNVGYNSCTAGAAIIRKLEEENNYNIPWSLTLLTDLAQNPNAVSFYETAIQQGCELGIFTWLIHSRNCTAQLFPLMARHPDCAFVLFCPADEISDELLAEADSLHNLMFAVRFEENTASVCEKLREKGFLYSVYFSYREEDAGLITSGGLLCSAEALHPAFTFFLPDASCPDYIEQLIYNYIRNTRNSQKYQTIPLDLVFDNRAIDSVISDDSCTAIFDAEGNLYTTFGQRDNPEYNLFQNSLVHIFKHAFPVSA